MKTSNFAMWSNNRDAMRGAISISRTPNFRSGWTKTMPECTLLFPSNALLMAYKEGEIGWEEYAMRYRAQLACLNLDKVWDYLHRLTVYEPILLCWESSKTLDKNPCHRRLVADWFERKLGLEIKEWTK